MPDQEELMEHVIDDTRSLGSGPFELLIGREFKLDIWEKLIKDMLIGEVSRFTCPYKVIMVYHLIIIITIIRDTPDI